MAEQDILQVIEARRNALHARDAAAFLETYAPDAVVFDLATPLSHPPDAAGIANWMATWDGQIVNETRDLRVVLSGDLALACGLERLAGSQGGVPRDIWLRFTLGLARGPRGWRVTHEHSSVPMRKEGGRLIGVTDLTP